MKKKNALTLAVSISVLTLALPVFFAQAAWSLGSVSIFGLPQGSIYDIIKNILNWLLALIGIVGIIGFAISGIMYLLSSGDEKLAGQAKSAMVNSIIGIIVALSGFVIVQAVDRMLNSTATF